MTKETAKKRAFNFMKKHYPLLRKGLIMYFVDVIVLTYEGFKLDPCYDDMCDSKKLAYSIEINTNDEYHFIINDYNDNINDNEKIKYTNSYALMLGGK